MRYRIRRHQLPSRPISSTPTLLPATLSASPCRPTGRIKARRHPTHYPLRLVSLAYSYRLHLIGSSVPPVACLPYSPHAVAIRLPPHAAHPSHRLIGLSSSHIAHAPSDEMSDEQAKRRTWQAIDDVQGERHDIRRLTGIANTHPRPPYSLYEPPNARTLPRTRPLGNDPSTSLTTPQTGRRTGRRERRPHRNAACLLTDTTTERRTPRRTATRPTTRKHGTKSGTMEAGREARRKAERTTGRISGKQGGARDGTKKNGPFLLNEKRPENRTRYQIKREDCYSPSLLESSGKRGKSRRRER